MRDSKHIDKILARLHRVWEANPDKRLSHLMWDGWYECGNEDLFEIEDEELIASIEEVCIKTEGGQ